MKKLINALICISLLGLVSPSFAEKPAEAPTTSVQKAVTSETVNLNSADAETLAKHLSGIGSAKAQAIVAYRDANGPFESIDELLEVKGIGTATLEKNKDRLTLKD